MKKNIICLIMVFSMFGAASASSLNERPEWETYKERSHNATDTTHIASANLIETEWEKYFNDRNVTGTVYIVDERGEGGNFVYNRDKPDGQGVSPDREGLSAEPASAVYKPRRLTTTGDATASRASLRAITSFTPASTFKIPHALFVFFAANIDMPNGEADLSKRTSIVQDVLRDINALD